MIKVAMAPRQLPGNQITRIIADEVERAGGVRVVHSDLTRPFLGRVDVLHIHWPDGVVAGQSRLKALARALIFQVWVSLSRLRGARVVWTAHNVGAHEGNHRWLERRHMRLFLRHVDAVVHLTPASVELLREAYPETGRKRHEIIPHPHYRGESPPSDRAQARRNAGTPVDAFIFGFVGMIRPYKGVETLIQAFQEIADGNVHLWITGAPSDDYTARSIQALTGANSRIKAELRHVDAQEIVDVVSGSDVIVLPYSKLLNSGVAILALSLGRPILAPRSGAIIDLHAALGSRWVQTFEGPLTRQDLERAQQAVRGRDPAELPDLGFLDPALIGARYNQLYRSLAG